MPVGAETLRLLIEANMSQEWLVKVVASLESDDSKPRSKNAERQARWRENHKPKAGSDVTDNVTRNATDNVTTVTLPCDDINTTNLQTTDKSVSSSTPPTRHQQRISRGTRWPDDFVPKPAPLEYWRANSGCSDEEYWEEFQQTGDFWRQRPGSKGLSLNWDLVWLNRVKDVCKLKKERRNGRTSTYSKPLSISERLAGFAARLDEADGESGDSGDREDAAGLPRLRQSA